MIHWIVSLSGEKLVNISGFNSDISLESDHYQLWGEGHDSNQIRRTMIRIACTAKKFPGYKDRSTIGETFRSMKYWKLLNTAGKVSPKCFIFKPDFRFAVPWLLSVSGYPSLFEIMSLILISCNDQVYIDNADSGWLARFINCVLLAMHSVRGCYQWLIFHGL